MLILSCTHLKQKGYLKNMQHSAEAAPPPSQPEQSAKMEVSQSRLKKFGHALLAGIVVAASLAGIRSTETEQPYEENPSALVEETPTVVSPIEGSNTIDVETPRQEIQTPNVNTYNSGDAIHFSSTGNGVNSYERDFQVEQKDVNQSREQIDTFVMNNAESIRTAIEDGQTISVTGLSSAEDDTPGGGLMEDDQPNAQGRDNTSLALERGNLAATELASSISEQLGIQLDSDQLTVSDIEDQWSQGQVDEATQLSEQFGYSSLENMVDQWNRGPKQKSEFPSAVQEFLASSLDQQRGFEISIPTTDEVVETPVSEMVSTPSAVETQPGEIAIDGHADLPAPADIGIHVNQKTGEVEFTDISGFPPPNTKVVETESDNTEKQDKNIKKHPVKVYPPTSHPVKGHIGGGKISKRQFKKQQKSNIPKKPEGNKLPHRNNGNKRNPSQRGERGAGSINRDRNGGRK